MFGLWTLTTTAPRVDVYGGLSRATYPTWAGLVNPAAGAALTRVAFIAQLLAAAKHSGGEAIDFAVMSIEDWTTLMTDFMSVERYNNDPSSRWGKDDPVNSGFRGLLLGDTPIFFDLNCPKGTAFLFNSKYITLVIHEDANFAWTGWYSTIPQGQIASASASRSRPSIWSAPSRPPGRSSRALPEGRHSVLRHLHDEVLSAAALSAAAELQAGVAGIPLPLHHSGLASARSALQPNPDPGDILD